MKLITKELAKQIPRLYSTENKPPSGKIVVAKFFTPDSNWTWYVIEGQNEHVRGSKTGDWRFFGLIVGQETEFGYFMLSELERARGPLGLPVERDLHWTPIPLSEVREYVALA